MRGGLLVVSGPSGVGKDTIINALQSSIVVPYHRVRTLTTRTSTAGHDPSYESVNPRNLLEALGAGRWIVNEQPSGAYATSIDEIQARIAKGFVCLHNVFPSAEGIGALREIFAGRMVGIGVLPPGTTDEKRQEHIRARLTSRARPGDDVERRIEAARGIMAYILSRPTTRSGDAVFDSVVVNDRLEACVDEIALIVARNFS